MEVIHTIGEIRARLDQLRKEIANKSKDAVGLIPTMGYLHEGHASLMDRARQECAVVVLSIYVNPLQFGPAEDFQRYPKDIARDLAYARKSGVDLVFIPDTHEMYPTPTKTKVIVSDLTETLCGLSRPGHFDGVSTVVAKLLNIVAPHRIYFGMKDAQQVAIVEQMVADLNIRVAVVHCPTVREADGLAMSSRNVYLSPEERKQAVVLSQALSRAEEWLSQESDAVTVEIRLRNFIAASNLAVIDYVQLLAYPSLQAFATLDSLGHEVEYILIALAVKFGRTRLIDNHIVKIK